MNERSDFPVLGVVLGPHPAAVREDISGEMLVARPDLDTTRFLDGIASMIYTLLDGRRTGEEIVDLLVGAFPESCEHVRRDTAELLEEFLASGIAERS